MKLHTLSPLKRGTGAAHIEIKVLPGCIITTIMLSLAGSIPLLRGLRGVFVNNAINRLLSVRSFQPSC
jgi:hypothetical protein